MPVDSLVQPSIMRYRRVKAVLSSEPAFASVQSNPTFEVKNRAGESSAYFSPEVAAITHRICLDGHDPLSVTKLSIIDYARKLLENTSGEVVVPEVKPVVDVPKKERKKLAKKSTKQVKTPSKEDTDAATPIREFSENYMFDLRVGMTSLLCSAFELAYNYDTTADRKEKLARLEKIIADYQPIRNQDAKETDKTD